MDVKIHTRSFTGSAPAQEGDYPSVQFNVLLEIDGVVHEKVGKVRLLAQPDNITRVVVCLYPNTIEMVNHTDDSWNDLYARVEVPG